MSELQQRKPATLTNKHTKRKQGQNGPRITGTNERQGVVGATCMHSHEAAEQIFIRQTET
ncbi:hypothetical protein COCVIDRAFT_24204 [Bipolaris victoriae FI3]|uniref:Uncharacterized protein n=1 Tax=Bipolaris victoriae (strain FI3) TaxID=930091 RepID=W7EPC9_BIPV3|nr:hypothetical protein COCVIDRAFT_24204 [Bipolaris victoriae FI3]